MKDDFPSTVAVNLVFRTGCQDPQKHLTGTQGGKQPARQGIYFSDWRGSVPNLVIMASCQDEWVGGASEFEEPPSFLNLD